MGQLRGVTLHRIVLPFRRQFISAHGIEIAKHATIVEVTTDDATGWSECSALRRPTYSSEYADGAFAILRDELVPAAIAGCASDVVGHPFAKAALEHALLDANLRAENISLATYLGVERPSVPAGVALGLTRDLAALIDDVAACVAEGYQRVKLKIAPGWDVVPVRAVRLAFPHLDLHVDANSAYTRDDADLLATLDPFTLQMIEQPLAAEDLEGHAVLASRIATPICLDESIASARSCIRALDLGSCRVVNLKPGRVGGVSEAIRIHDLCVARGVPLWCGGMFETGIGRALNVAIAALPGFTLTGDLSASQRFFDVDITDPFVLTDGRLRVPTGPGIGVAIDTNQLRSCTIGSVTLRRD